MLESEGKDLRSLRHLKNGAGAPEGGFMFYTVLTARKRQTKTSKSHKASNTGEFTQRQKGSKNRL